MNKKLKFSIALLIPALLLSCSSGDSPFAPDNVVGNIVTGIADQDSFTIGFDPTNPAGFNFNGATSTITVHVADRNNNAVPDGALVYFRTTGGSIEPACSTTDGTCSVTWTSQNPRPANGLANILVYTAGSESFIDSSDPINNLYDFGETITTQLGEAFLDMDNDGIYDAGVEPYIDLDNSGTYTVANTLYDGDLCGSSSNCGSSTINVFAQGNLAMSSSFTDASNIFTFTLSDFNINGVGGTDLAGTGTTLAQNAEGSFVLSALDLNGNALPVGTDIDITVVGGAVNPASFTVPNNGQTIYNFAVTAGAATITGSITINITTPSGGTASEVIVLNVP